MKKLIHAFLTLSICLATQLSAQTTWNTVGSGLPVTTSLPSNLVNFDLASTTYNSELYVAYTYRQATGSTTNEFTELAKWNGLNWVSAPARMSTSNIFRCSDVAVTSTGAYVSNDWVSNTPLYRFNGTSWDSLGLSGFSGSVNCIEAVGNDIYIGGNFTANGGVANILKFDGTNYINLPNLPSTSLIINDIISFNGQIYVSTEHMGLSIDSLVYQLNTSTNQWQPTLSVLSNGVFGSGVFKFIEYAGDLYGYAYHTNQLFKRSNDTLYRLNNAPHVITSATTLGNKIYLASTSSSTYPQLSSYNGTIFSSIFNTPYPITILEAYANELYSISSFRAIYNGITQNRAYRSQDSNSVISGVAFLDSNNNCFKDTGEAMLDKILVKIGTYAVASDSNGQFSASVLPGNYTFSVIPGFSLANKNLTLNCSTSNQITVGPNQSVTQNVPLNNIVPIDMATGVYCRFGGWRARYGFTETYKIDVVNTGNATLASGTYSITVPPSVTILQTTPPPASQTGNVLTFNILNAQPYETRSVLITARIDTATNNIGDTIMWVSSLGIIANDADLTDNTDTLRQEVRGAYDPNDKQASETRILPTTTRLDYHIRFQNTGNDTAYKVTVVDSLDLSFPITNVIINSASHPYTFSLVNNVLVWEFFNIMLPDSSTDLLGSQGYVNFSTGLNPSLAVGDTIKNDAQIYFDFQHPVHTNTAKTAVVSNISVAENSALQPDVKLYPNPSRDAFFVENLTTETVEAIFVNNQGQTVRKEILQANEKLRIDISGLPAGMYILCTSQMAHKILIAH